MRGAGGPSLPPRKKKKRKKERKKEKREREKKRKKKEWNYECCFFQFFNSPVALKNKKNFGPLPQEQVEMTPLIKHLLMFIVVVVIFFIVVVFINNETDNKDFE